MSYSYIIVNCYIENPEGKIMIVNLNKTGKWSLPGGKVEIGENLKDALLREVEEELGIEIKIDKLIGFREYFWENDNAYWIDLIYKSNLITNKPNIKEPEKIKALE